MLGVLFGFFVVLGGAALLDGSYVFGPVSVIAGLGAWLYYASLRVTVTPMKVVVRRYGRVIFSAPRYKIRASVGRGGELKTHTALILEAPDQQQVELLRTLFGKETLTELASMLNVPEEIPGGIF